MTKNEFQEEIRMLQGNIARICVTDDLDELNCMVNYAIRRLVRIYEYRLYLLGGKKD